MPGEQPEIERILLAAADVEGIEGALVEAAELAASRRDGAALREVGSQLEELAAIRAALVTVAGRLSAFESIGDIVAAIIREDAAGSEPETAPAPNRRQHARACRNLVVERLRAEGVELSSISEAVYRTPSGKRVGMPFASEIDGGWWLGLYEGRFDVALLLCERDGDVELVYLDERFFARYGTQLSRDSKNNVKFNVGRGDRGYLLEIPGLDPVIVANVDIVAELA